MPALMRYPECEELYRRAPLRRSTASTTATSKKPILSGKIGPAGRAAPIPNHYGRGYRSQHGSQGQPNQIRRSGAAPASHRRPTRPVAAIPLSANQRDVPYRLPGADSSIASSMSPSESATASFVKKSSNRRTATQKVADACSPLSPDQQIGVVELRRKQMAGEAFLVDRRRGYIGCNPSASP